MSNTNVLEITNTCLEQFMACDFVIAFYWKYLRQNGINLKSPYIPLRDSFVVQNVVPKSDNFKSSTMTSKDKGKVSSGTSDDKSNTSTDGKERDDPSINSTGNTSSFVAAGVDNTLGVIKFACETQNFLAYPILFPEILSQLKTYYRLPDSENSSSEEIDKHKKLSNTIKSSLGFEVAPEMIQTLRELISIIGKIFPENDRDRLQYHVPIKDVLRNDVLTHASEENLSKLHKKDGDLEQTQ